MPLAIAANFFAFSAGSFALSYEIFIHLTVAVVVFSIADLWRRLLGRAGSPLASGAGLISATALGQAGALDPIDFAIAVIVLSVADFGFGLWCCAGLPLASNAGFSAFPAVG